MNKTSIVGFVIAIIFAVICYFASSSLIATIIILVATIAYFLFLVGPRFKKFQKKITRYHDCYCFVNNFLISLSIKESINGAFESASAALDNNFHEEEEEAMKDLTDNEKILYLQRYFPFHIYQLFTDIVLLWCEQGGHILDMSIYLNNQARETEEYILFCQSANRKTLLDFSLLWSFSLVILFILRFALSDFYVYIVNQSFYPYAILSIFFIALFSIEILTRRMTKLEIRGWNNHD